MDSFSSNKALSLTTFFTDPLVVRKGVPGTLANKTPFSVENNIGGTEVQVINPMTIEKDFRSTTSNEEIAQGAAYYWMPHLEVFKEKPGPLSKNGQFLMTSAGSPGKYNFRINDAEDALIAPNDETTHTNPNVENPFSSVNLDSALTIEDRENAFNDLTTSYTDINSNNVNYKFSETRHIGLSGFDHRILTFNQNGYFIKNSPFSSVSELCDVPAPNIEKAISQAAYGPNPIEVGNNPSLINSFVDGEENAVQYFTKEQKEAIFSSATVEGTAIDLSGITKMNFNNNATTIFGESVNSEPRGFKTAADSPLENKWGLSYILKAVGVTKKINPGKYKLFISGLNSKDSGKIWDVLKSIVVIPDGNLIRGSDQIGFTKDYIERLGGSYIGGDEGKPISQIQVSDESGNPQILEDFHMVQLVPLNGAETFNIQEYLEINLISNPDSDFLKEDYLQNPENPTGTLKMVLDSKEFKKIKIHIVPEGSTGKVNINTATIQTLLRIPGFSNAVDTALTNTIQQHAANEVVHDIIRAVHSNDKIFTDAGDFLSYENAAAEEDEEDSYDRGGFRMFPVNEGDVPESYSGELLSREILAREKLKLFRTALPYIQFDGSSYLIVALGQSIKKVGGTDDKPIYKVLASSKIEANINLNKLLKGIRQKYVKDNFTMNVSAS